MEELLVTKRPGTRGKGRWEVRGGGGEGGGGAVNACALLKHVKGRVQSEDHFQERKPRAKTRDLGSHWGHKLSNPRTPYYTIHTSGGVRVEILYSGRVTSGQCGLEAGKGDVLRERQTDSHRQTQRDRDREIKLYFSTVKEREREREREREPDRILKMFNINELQ